MRAVHLPFAVETMGGLSKSALQLVREIHHSVFDFVARPVFSNTALCVCAYDCFYDCHSHPSQQRQQCGEAAMRKQPSATHMCDTGSVTHNLRFYNTTRVNMSTASTSTFTCRELY